MYGLIYMHTCSITGKSYIGQTTRTMKERLVEHMLDRNMSKFHKALKKYNEKHWTHKILAYADSKEDLDFLEIYFIKKFNTIKNGYNLKEGGSYGLHSEETKKKISKAKIGIGHPHSDCSKKKISEALKGIKFSEVHKQKISESKKGKRLSFSQIEYLRNRFSGIKNPNYGKKTKKESIKKMRLKMGKKVLCVETGKIYSCSGEAAEYLGVKRCGIQRCLLKGGTSHGYHWNYVEQKGGSKC